MFLTIIKLMLVGLIPVFFSGLMDILERKTKLNSFNKVAKQIIIGVAFGLLSIVGNELGVKSPSGAIISVRDTGPAIAGLLFGLPAGIIAGFIGGVERFFAVYWGASMPLRWACSIATCLAGVFAGLVRKVVFDNKQGKWYYGFILGLFIESVHMLLVFITNINDIEYATTVIEMCAIPMIVANSLCIVFSLIWVTILNKEPVFESKRPRSISFKVQIGLTAILVLSFVLVASLSFTILDNLSTASSTDSLIQNIEDVKSDVDNKLDSQMTSLAERIASDITLTYDTEGSFDFDYLKYLSINLKVSEINVIGYDEVSGNDNIILFTTSTREGVLNFDMSTPGQAKEFECLLVDNGPETYVQEYGQISQNSDIYMKYAGARIYIPGYSYIQVGYNKTDYHKYVDGLVKETTEYRHIGETGFVLIATENNKIIGGPKEIIDTTINVKDVQLKTLELKNIEGEDYYYYAEYIEGYYIVAVYSYEEAIQSRNTASYVTFIIEIIIFCLLYMIIYVALKKLVVDKVEEINDSLENICQGNLNIKVNANNTYELKVLSEHINQTVDSLKSYTEEAAKKMEKDLTLAKNIQHSVLPSTFPPFPSHHEFDIYASMDTAKEVGGDFFDFYLTDDTHLAILVADVSGKGIPAAMFMMQAKTIIKSLVESGMELDNAFTIANKKLCEGNDAQMFVTAWMGIINLENGHVNYVNAGHNPPLLYKKGVGFDYLKGKTGFVLAGMDGIRYKLQEFQLDADEQIYLYTDGVTEANNKEGNLYGEDRLLELANKSYGISAESFCQAVMEDVVKFENGADQFDDITMLTVKYFGKRNLEEIKVRADVKDGEKVINFVNDFLEKNDASIKAINQIDVAVDEVFSNIAFYAYKEGNSGKVNVTIEAIDDYVTLTFEDHGIEYNPLLNEDPDVTLSAEERKIGGLGIFIVKKTMDEVNYVNTNGRNLLTIKKKIK